MKVDLKTFCANNPTFEFGATPIDLYLSEDREKKLDGVDVDKTEELTAQLKSMQRVFKITSNFAQMSTLLADDLHSSQAIVYMGQRAFVDRHRETFGGEELAFAAYKQAEHIHDMSLMLYARHSTAFNAPTPYVISGDPSKAVSQAMLLAPTPTNDAAWRTLFGSIDLCDCEHCKSVYSPAAYLVDILKFLKDGPTKNSKTPLQVLLERRPDLEHIELTCENTDTRLPYVDLVQEVLENTIAAPFVPFDIIPTTTPPWTPETDLDKDTLSPELRNAFAGKNITLPQNAVITVVEAGKHWLITDHARLYTVIKALNSSNVTVISQDLQTGGTAEELSANPEHINPEAYNKLANAVFPWSLPLNLWAEEARVYLNHLDVHRSEMMETFYKGTPLTTLADPAIAMEYLELTMFEWQIITGGLKVRLATTTNLNNLNRPTERRVIDSVAVAVGDRVLVKDQANAADNGIYIVTPGLGVGLIDPSILLRASESAFLPAFVSVQAGTTYQDSGWLLTIGANGNLSVAALQPGDWWGLSQQVNGLRDTFDGTTVSGNWDEVLKKRVSILLQQSGLSYKDLLELLGTYFVNPVTAPGGRTLSLVSTSTDPKESATCNLSKLEIKWLDATILGKIHRFVRLWHKLGWTMRDLDKVITALKPTDLNDDFLVQLSHIQRLRAKLNVPLVNMLSWWEAIGTASYIDHLAETQPEVASLYKQLFRNKAVINPVDEAFTEDASALSGKISDHLPTILAALGISATDLSLLMTGTAAVVTDDKLNLANLSHLYRVASLAKALKLSIRELLSVKALTGIDPFAATEATLRFVEKVGVIRASGFSINELDYLLRHQYVVSTGVAPTDESIAAILAGIQDGLQKIKLETTLVPDPTGEVTRSKLALVLSAQQVEASFALIAGSSQQSADDQKAFIQDNFKLFLVMQVEMDAAKSKLVDNLPTSAADREIQKQERFESILMPLMVYLRRSSSESLVKQKLSEALKLDTALTELLLQKMLKSRTDANQPAMSDFLALLDGGLSATYFDNQDLTGATVKRTDPMIDFNWTSGSPDPNIAVGTFSARWIGKVQPQRSETYTFFARIDDGVRLWADNQLIIDQWQDQPAAEYSAAIALKAGRLYDLKMEYYQNGFDAVAELRWSSPSTPKAIISAEYLFPDAPVLTYQSLHKIARLISAFKISDEELTYLSAHSTDQKWLDLTALPLVETQLPALFFAAWERMVNLFRFRDSLPSGKVQLFSIFKQAANPTTTKADLLKTLSERTGWNLSDLEFLDSTQGLGLAFPDDFKDERALVRLQTCFKLMKRLGASAKQLCDWGKVNQITTEEMDNARSIKNAVKAKYDDKQWLVVAKPLRDVLREKQRAVLVSYLVAERGVRDANELYKDFLIDLEMSPCMMTTRIKQAISSVQLFIQRCLMNLEPDVSLTLEEAKEWGQWRKQYRIWEANRKVFLYPENWIEPELRDDKSPFFKDLENELLQNDVTMDTAETAFLHYLEKLDEVARLEIVGMYQQKETAIGNEKAIDILHVFGRTFAIPHIYYYRRLEDSVWSAWEKVDLDIEGDHLIPIVWDRRLYLFWPIFTEKASTPTEPEKKAGADPTKYWEIHLAWSEYKNGKWSAKKVSSEFLPSRESPSTTLPEKHTYLFKGLDNPPAIRCFRSVTQTFVMGPGPGQQQPGGGSSPSEGSGGTLSGSGNGTTDELVGTVIGVVFHDLNNNKSREPNELGIPGAIVRADAQSVETDDNGQYELTVSLRGSLTHRVWITPPEGFACNTAKSVMVTLSSTQKLKNADFGLVQAVPPTIIQSIMPIGEFRFVGCQGMLKVFPKSNSRSIQTPTGTHVESMMFVEDGNTDGRFLISGYYGDDRIDRYDQPVLGKTPGTFRLLLPHQDVRLTQLSSLFYQDDLRTYFVTPTDDKIWFDPFALRLRWFTTHFHPQVCDLIKALKRGGIPSLLTLANQRLTDLGSVFSTEYDPKIAVYSSDFPKEDVDFNYSGAYSLYNWELFFHVPFLIATRLSKNQRFEEAQKWYHYMLDPTSSEPGGPERFWKVKPFYEETRKGIRTLEELMDEGADLDQQLTQWKENPFKPHAIARLRTVAYMKTVVMKYIDNLIAWGDQLFRRESINEATQIYILAAQILGRRPEEIPPRAVPEVQTFNSIDKQLTDEKQLTEFFGPQVNIENYIFPSGPSNTSSTSGTSSLGTMPLFCIPKNDKLLGYWSTVADRLFKIRHCMNIEGVVRQLPIYEPPIDPALLVRAAAAGMDISSALGDIYAALPHYRFNVMVQKATELCNDVKSLGTALLSALEKGDAEALALLRSGHEIKLLDAVQQIKEKQVDEANDALEGLKKTREMVGIRQVYYQNVAFMNDWETIGLYLMGGSLLSQMISTLLGITATGGYAFPSLTVGAAGISSPVALLTYGGPNLGHASASASEVMRGIAGILNTGASMSSTLGGYWRRMDEWQLQESLASKELEQLDKQIAAAEIRVAIAERELENHKLQVENAKEVDAYMRDKYTNQELYNWMVGQISSIYFQSYQMAYDIAKRAERAFRHELGLSESDFIQFGYWDSLKKGLLAGERLHYDLKRMDVAYLDQNKREYEITKHVSLVLHDPMSLIALKETGTCFVSLPEALFDMDYPGHYMRRIKSASLTIPCVTGPYTSINCTLTLLKNSIRMNSDLTSGPDPYSGPINAEDKRFSTTFGAIESIATSAAQNDSGMFEVSFRDERYLPFEGAGAVSTWRIDMPKDCNAFAFETISDVIIRLNYTAREGGSRLSAEAKKAAQLPKSIAQSMPTSSTQPPDQLNLTRMFSVKHEFSSEWYRFLHPADITKDPQVLSLGLTQERFPFQFKGRQIDIKRIYIFLKLNDKVYYNDDLVFALGKEAINDSSQITDYPGTFKATGSPIYKLPHAELFKDQVETVGLWKWSIVVARDDVNNLQSDPTHPPSPSLKQTVKVNGKDYVRLNPDAIADIWIVCEYQVVK